MLEKRAEVKKYFEPVSKVGPILLIGIGSFLLLICYICFELGLVGNGFGWAILGLILIAIAIYWFKKINDIVANDDVVDEVLNYDVNKVKAESLDKLNLIAEQVEHVEPMVIYGPAYKTGRYSQKYKIGKDGKLRYSLVNVMIYMFGEKQLYVYNSCFDLLTGSTYYEGTDEMFYSDISAVSFEQEKISAYSNMTKSHDKRVIESFTINLSGSTYKAGVANDIENAAMDKQFRVLRNLIRDRKNY